MCVLKYKRQTGNGQERGRCSFQRFDHLAAVVIRQPDIGQQVKMILRSINIGNCEQMLLSHQMDHFDILATIAR